MNCPCSMLSVIFGLSGFTAFSHIFSSKARFSEEKLLNMKCVLWVFCTFLWYIFFFIPKENWTTHYHKCRSAFIWSSRYSCHIITKLEFSLEIFSKTNAETQNFFKIRQVGAESFLADGQTQRDGHMTKLLDAFCSFVKAPIGRAV